MHSKTLLVFLVVLACWSVADAGSKSKYHSHCKHSGGKSKCKKSHEHTHYVPIYLPPVVAKPYDPMPHPIPVVHPAPMPWHGPVPCDGPVPCNGPMPCNGPVPCHGPVVAPHYPVYAPPPPPPHYIEPHVMPHDEPEIIDDCK